MTYHAFKEYFDQVTAKIVGPDQSGFLHIRTCRDGDVVSLTLYHVPSAKQLKDMCDTWVLEDGKKVKALTLWLLDHIPTKKAFGYFHEGVDCPADVINLRTAFPARTCFHYTVRDKVVDLPFDAEMTIEGLAEDVRDAHQTSEDVVAFLLDLGERAPEERKGLNNVRASVLYTECKAFCRASKDLKAETQQMFGRNMTKLAARARRRGVFKKASPTASDTASTRRSTRSSSSRRAALRSTTRRLAWQR